MKHFKPKEARDSCAENRRRCSSIAAARWSIYFVGHPVGAQHVAWNDGPDWEINPHFVGQVKKVASMNRPDRADLPQRPSLARRRRRAGEGRLRRVYNVQDGFEGPLDDKHHRGTISGWRKEGLPWEQS